MRAVDEGQCWVCCEGSSAERPLLYTGCACRGSAGLAHLECLVQAATHDVECWTTCPTCRQEYTGAADVGLARARWELVRARPAEDEERLFVANNLAVTLKESAGDNEGATRARTDGASALAARQARAGRGRRRPPRMGRRRASGSAREARF